MALTAGEILHRPKNWIVATLPPVELQQSLPEVHPLLLRILFNRRIVDPDDIKRHSEAGLDQLHDPFLMPQMAAAVARLALARQRGETVVIYGDFDADGVTGSTILYRALSMLGIAARSYIPKRLEDGYGLHSDAIDLLQAEGARVLITVDCGIGSVAEVAHAGTLGVDVIICDHHSIGPALPQAEAILHPEMGGYPFPYLCAAGVALKLAQAILRDGLGNAPDALPSGALEELVEFAAIGTLADMVPLTGENRVLAARGLDRLRARPSRGVRAMAEAAGVDITRLSCRDVSFSLAPLINASGRLDDAGIAYKLMTAEEEDEAAILAARLRELNGERRRLTEEVLSAAREQLKNADPAALAFVVGGEGWPPGVVGLVAGKLCEELAKPVFAMELGQDVCRGSARGVAGFDLVEALGLCRHLLVRYGGHPRAAGFTLRREAFEEFSLAMSNHANATLSARNLEPAINIDSELKMRHLTWDVYELIQRVAPFGVGNPTPTFMIRGLRAIKPRSTATNHLRMAFTDGRQTIDAFAFGMGYCAEWIKQNPLIDVAFELTSSDFQGYRTLELRVKDLRVCSRS